MRIFRYPGPLWRLRSLAGTALVIPSIAAAWMAVVVAKRFGAEKKTLDRILRLWTGAGQIFWAIRVVVDDRRGPGNDGGSGFDSAGGSLVISNHQSGIDFAAILWAFGGDLRFLANENLFRIPFFGWGMRETGFVPLSGGNRASAAMALKNLLARIGEGWKMLVFPEGWRSSTAPSVEDFKPGSFRMAIEYGLRLQPIAVVDAFRVMPKYNLWPRPGTTIHLVLLPPIDAAAWKDRGAPALAQHLRGLLQDTINAKLLESLDHDKRHSDEP